MPNFLENISSEDSNSPEAQKEVNNVLAYWGKYLNSENFSDFTIAVGKEGTELKKIYVNKMILNRSTYFETMFKHTECEENLQNEMTINDLEYEIVYEMLRFIYTSKVKNMSTLADGLLVATEKYNLQGLKDRCQKQLIRTLDVENAVDMLLLSDTHRANQLKEATLKLIDEDFDRVILTRGWKKAKERNKLWIEMCEYIKSPLKRPKLSNDE